MNYLRSNGFRMDNSYECILKKFAHYTINKPNEKIVETGTLFHWIVSKDIFIMAQMLQKREIWNYLA